MHQLLIVSDTREEAALLESLFDESWQISTLNYVQAYASQHLGRPHVVLMLETSLEKQIQLTKHLRSKLHTNAPGILAIVKDSSVATQTQVFEAGVDHWLSAPIVFDAIKLHIMSIHRRSLGHSSDGRPDLQWGPLKIKVQRSIVEFEGKNLTLEPIQLKLLLAFVDNENQLLSRSWLAWNIWGASNALKTARSIDAQISKLRKKLPPISNYLISVHGKGYLLTTPMIGLTVAAKAS